MTIQDLPRFYHPNLNQSSILLDEEESRHVKVLRLNSGDAVHLINGLGQLYSGHITKVGKTTTVAVVEMILSESNPSRQLHLAVAPTKNNQRIEWLLEKITEVGVNSFMPIICEHSEKTHLKIDRLQRIALSAIKQSKHLFLPEISEPISFSALCQMQFDNKYIAHCHAESVRQTVETFKTAKGKSLICIGPEGDFSKVEIEQAENLGFIPIDLGEQRLRTETAALVASVLFQF